MLYRFFLFLTIPNFCGLQKGPVSVVDVISAYTGLPIFAHSRQYLTIKAVETNAFLQLEFGVSVSSACQTCLV